LTQSNNDIFSILLSCIDFQTVWTNSIFTS
jgi:hypothetical protein